MCIGCDQDLSIEHILLTCMDFIEIRESHFTANSLRMLFQDISPRDDFYFLEEINIFGEVYKKDPKGSIQNEMSPMKC